MTETAFPTPPLTRREAREIERRIGNRRATGAIAPVTAPLAPAPDTFNPLAFRHDTAEIERNTDTALVSVFPTEMIERSADFSPEPVEVDEAEASAFVRPVSIRAARPAALVARSRRRAAAGLGIAASAAVLATAAIAAPGVASGQGANEAAMASLVRAGVDGAGEGQVTNDTIIDSEAAGDLVAAPATAPDRGSYAVTSFGTDAVQEVVVDDSTGTSTGGSSNGGSSTGNSGGGADTYNGGNGYDTSSIEGIAWSMMGGGYGWACTDFTRAVYAQAGITLPGGGVSAQAAGGTPTSNPQVGDLVIFYSGHVGIYAGNGMMWDNPGYRSDYVGWQNVHRSISVIGSGYYFVTYR